MVEVGLDARNWDPLALIGHPFLVVVLILLFDQFDILLNRIGCLYALTNLEVEVTEVKRTQVDIFVDLLDLFKVVARVQDVLLNHLHIALVGAQPLLEYLCFLTDIDAGRLGLSQQTTHFVCVLLVLECHVVVESVGEPSSLVRLNGLLRGLDELRNCLRAVNLP